MTNASLSIELSDTNPTGRRCGDCTLCCTLLAVKELAKPAGTRCQYQRFRGGCTIYARRPMSCAAWSCRWLVDSEAHGLPRPDRGHFVVDIMPDEILAGPPGETPQPVGVVQVWLDPAYPDAHRHAGLRAYLDRLAERDGTPAVIRCGDQPAWLLVPPALSGDGTWREMRGGTHREVKRSMLLDRLAAERAAARAGAD